MPFECGECRGKGSFQEVHSQCSGTGCWACSNTGWVEAECEPCDGTGAELCDSCNSEPAEKTDEYGFFVCSLCIEEEEPARCTHCGEPANFVDKDGYGKPCCNRCEAEEAA